MLINDKNNEKIIRALAISLTIMLGWILIWALVFKLCDEETLVRNYYNMQNMSLIDRIMWDLIPFNYRGEEYWIKRQILVTILNCFVFAPFGVTLGYIFKKTNFLRDLALCLAFSLAIEITQAFTSFGNPATEDLITNVFGYFIGFAVYRLIFKRLSNKQSVVALVSFNALALVVSAYAVYTSILTAPLIYQLITRTY